MLPRTKQGTARKLCPVNLFYFSDLLKCLREIRDPSRGQADGMMDTVEYRCPQCGATVHASETSAASFCSYCGT